MRISRRVCRVAGMVFACAIALDVAAQAAEGVGESSLEAAHRAVVDANAYPWSAVGAIFNSDRTECTAVAISADQVLTAAHCLYGHRTGHLMQPGSLHVLLGFVRGNYAVDATVRSYHIAARYDRSQPNDTRVADWAMLRLETALPVDRGPIALAARRPDAGTPVMAGGYGHDRAFMMTADPDCRVLRVAASGLLLSNCRTLHGYSGGPLLAPLSGTDRVEVVGINIALSTVGSAEVTVTVPAVSIRQELEAAVAHPAGEDTRQ